MNKTLTSIFKTQGPQSLNISNQSFSKKNIFEECMDSSFFHHVNSINCFFEGCKLLGVNFNFCVFEGCTFNHTIIRKSEFTDYVFKNCQFLSLYPNVTFLENLL